MRLCYYWKMPIYALLCQGFFRVLCINLVNAVHNGKIEENNRVAYGLFL